MAAKTVNQVKYLIKGKESRKKTLLNEVGTVNGQIAKLKNEMVAALKRQKAALAVKAKKSKLKKKR